MITSIATVDVAVAIRDDREKPNPIT